MIKVLLPATNHKPQWVELFVDDHYTGRVWAHSIEVSADQAVHQFHVVINNADDLTQCYLWADTIEKAKE
jgi:hypothetical protein